MQYTKRTCGGKAVRKAARGPTDLIELSRVSV
jgi:hypothetical protein